MHLRFLQCMYGWWSGYKSHLQCASWKVLNNLKWMRICRGGGVVLEIQRPADQNAFWELFSWRSASEFFFFFSISSRPPPQIINGHPLRDNTTDNVALGTVCLSFSLPSLWWKCLHIQCTYPHVEAMSLTLEHEIKSLENGDYYNGHLLPVKHAAG